MRLLRLADVETSRTDRMFYHSRERALFWALAIAFGSAVLALY
jgi:hypothetical protein